MLLWFACAEDPEVTFARARDAHDVETLARFCAEGRAEACGLAAAAAKPDDPRLRGWDEGICDAGGSEALASCLRRTERPTDRFRAAACKLGDDPSCLAAGDAARATGDRVAAGVLYQARCDRRPEDAACVLAARMKEPAPSLPAGTPAEITAALWARCDADDGPACLQLSEHVAGGGPLPPDPRKSTPAAWDAPTAAQWLRAQACDLQVTYACAFHHW